MGKPTLSSSFRRLFLAAAIVAGTTVALPARADLQWDWNYTGTGIAAGGTLLTSDTANAEGYYTIIGISGSRNGIAITGLQPTGTPIPGNEPYDVDNLLRAGTQQLTGDGFGYSTALGHYASPFYADFLPTPGYLEVFSAPPFVSGAVNLGPEDSELPISFHARMVSPVPEPGTLLLSALGGLGLLAWTRRRAARLGAIAALQPR